jgi:lysozyme
VLKGIPPAAGTLAGIDVSHFQQDIDWAPVGASGVNYCFIKATEGVSLADEKFSRNWQAASEARVLRGAYHLFQPSDSVTAQSDFFLRTVSPLQPGDLPPVLDLENPTAWTSVPPQDRAQLAIEWLQAVEQGLGVRPLIYLSPSFAAETLANSPLLARFQVWLADYTSAPAPSIPKPWDEWTFWQHTARGTIPGIAVLVDLNRFNGTIEELKILKAR